MQTNSSPEIVIKETNLASFKQDVIDASQHKIVLVDFTASWCGPCKQLKPLLEKYTRAAQGKVDLILVDIDQYRPIAEHMRIQTVPTVFAFYQGQPIDGFQGAIPESQLKPWMDKVLQTINDDSPFDKIYTQAIALLENKYYEEAEKLFQQLLLHQPTNINHFIGLLRTYLFSKQRSKAKELLSRVPEAHLSKPEILNIKVALELYEEGEKYKSEADNLTKNIDKNKADHESGNALALFYFSENRTEDAITLLLDSVRENRNWNEEKSKKNLMRIFEALGQTHPLTVQGRKQLAAIIFA